GRTAVDFSDAERAALRVQPDPAAAARRCIGHRPLHPGEPGVQSARTQSHTDVPDARTVDRVENFSGHRWTAVRPHSESSASFIGLLLVFTEGLRPSDSRTRALARDRVSDSETYDIDSGTALRISLDSPLRASGVGGRRDAEHAAAARSR